MNDLQAVRLATAFALQAAKTPGPSLCTVCVNVLTVAGVGITIMGGNQAGPVCVSDERMAALEDLQFTLGEGPCQDAFHTRGPVLVPRLDDAAFARWPAFIAEARDSGVEAVFAYPLTAARSKVGVLTLYQDQPGDLTRDQRDNSEALADILAHTILGMQAAAPPGMLPVELDEAVAHRAEVHQASGMVAIQLQVPVVEALAALRAHAFAQDRALADVAADVVAHRLRLSDDHDRNDEETNDQGRA
ncbi:MAG TPA: GAF and ANTAR domain-containing protein [Acidimicrobiales bacterium]|nr:GAF and ANTAR domain-containing protein [Acidimicrobiales bacterium]